MKLSELSDHDKSSAARRVTDPEYAAEVDRLAPAAALSAIVVDYRAKNGLSQTDLGRLLGWKQPQVARLERGDHLPSLETLQLLARHRIVTIRVDEKGTRLRAPTATTARVVAAKQASGATSRRAAATRVPKA